jgi:hypothetical protein
VASSRPCSTGSCSRSIRLVPTRAPDRAYDVTSCLGGHIPAGARVGDLGLSVVQRSCDAIASRLPTCRRSRSRIVGAL